MNAKAKRTHLKLVKADHKKHLADLCRDALGEIFNESIRIHRTGRTVTVSLHPDFVSVFVHEKDDVASCISHNADLDNADALIDLLENLEAVTNPVYDLEEVPSNAEAF